MIKSFSNHKNNQSLFIVCVLLFCVLLSLPVNAQKLNNLKCEYLINPIGIDVRHPRLAWLLSDESIGAKQTAYQLWVSTDSVTLGKGMANAWQTSKVLGDVSLVIYQGKSLQPFTKYYWKVTVWDNAKAITSGITSFETGMMDKRNWQGTWISDNKDIHENAAPYFRNTFKVEKKIVSARAYIAAAGLYEFYLNGEKVGNHRLDPMYTRFDRRTLYVSYDITYQIKSGENAVGVLLGNGWYNHQSTAVWYFHNAPWRGRPTFCMDLRITYSDGSTKIIKSDTTWRTSLSPITFNSIYTAEHYDARLEQPGWNTTAFDMVGKHWTNVIGRSSPSTNIVSQAMQPIRAVETIPAVSIEKLGENLYLYNLGRNISGVSRITVKGAAGTIVRLKHAERLNKDGHADQSNIDYHYRPTDDKDPFQTDIFILSGKGSETFMPRFNYKGFQYVEVSSDKPIELEKESLTGYFMHSDVEAIGQINSSSSTLNKIWYATNNSYLSNLFGYPTDCPQREKNGWTGDAHIASETGLYGFDGITIYEKWMADHRDEQQPNGVLPAIIPTSGWGYDWANGPDWTSTIAIIPWNIYQFYGDTKCLVDNYDNIKHYVDYIDELAPAGITSWGLGDWVPVSVKPPVDFTSTAYYYTDVNILAKTAALLHHDADAIKYKTLALKIRNAFNAKFLNAKTGIYGKGLQTEQSIPLFWGIAPDNLKGKIAADLAEKVKQDNYHLNTGILGAKAVLGALSDNGYANVAYKIASQETYPSWGWWIVNGATTLYENWNIDATRDISLNHIMFGEINAWYYKSLGGIKIDPQHPGFKNILLEPNFVEGIDHFESSHTGPYGKIVSVWKKANGVISYNVTVPANSTATVNLNRMNGKKIYLDGHLMNVNKFQLPSGRFKFVIN